MSSGDDGTLLVWDTSNGVVRVMCFLVVLYTITERFLAQSLIESYQSYLIFISYQSEYEPQ